MKIVEWYVEMITFTNFISVQECTEVSFVKSTRHYRRIGCVQRDIKLLNCMKTVGWSVKIITSIDLISVQE